MTKDEATLLLLAAEALRSDRLTHEACMLLADALDRIAGAESTSGRSVSRSEAIRISEETLLRAEQERVTVLEDAEGDDPRFEPEPENPFSLDDTPARFTPRGSYEFESACGCGFKPTPGAMFPIDKYGNVSCPKCNEDWPKFFLPVDMEKP